MLNPRTSPFEWDPFAALRSLQEDVNRSLDGGVVRQAVQAFPPVNVWVGDNSVVVTAELPGLARDDIELTVEDDALTIKGERKPATDDAGVTWHRRERGYGAFSRTIGLPFRVDPERVQARFANGLLEVEMQRPEADLPRKIQIKSK